MLKGVRGVVLICANHASGFFTNSDDQRGTEARELAGDALAEPGPTSRHEHGLALEGPRLEGAVPGCGGLGQSDLLGHETPFPAEAVGERNYVVYGTLGKAESPGAQGLREVLPRLRGTAPESMAPGNP